MKLESEPCRAIPALLRVSLLSWHVSPEMQGHNVITLQAYPADTKVVTLQPQNCPAHGCIYHKGPTQTIPMAPGCPEDALAAPDINKAIGSN